MKRISSFIKFGIVLLLVITSTGVSAQCTQNNISGSSYILLDNSGSGDEDYSITVPGGATNYQWTTAGGSIFAFGDDDSEATLHVGDGIINCQIQITVNYTDASGNPGCNTFIVTVLPYLPYPSPGFCINPGATYTQNLTDKCNGIVSFAHQWSTGTYNYIQGSLTGPSCVISPPMSGAPAAITLNCSVSGPPTSGFVALNAITINVCLPTPVISGPSCFGCNTCPVQTGNITLTASSPGGSFYVWTVISNNCMNVLTSLNGPPTLQLSAYAMGNFAVSVKAYSGNPAIASYATSNSNSSTFNIQSCCASNLNISTNVTSPSVDQNQAGVGVTAVNIVSSGATAEYHAGSNVTMNPGFSANAGSYFHAYLEGCLATGGYYRTMQIDTTGSSAIEPIPVSAQNSQIPQAASLTNGSVALRASSRISVFPNPTSGNLNIRFSRAQSITLYLSDLTGNMLLTQKMNVGIGDNSNQLDLSGISEGMYILQMLDQKGNSLKTQKVVVQR